VGNIYNLYKVVVNTPNSAPGLWLYIADNVIGSSVLTVTLKNSSGTSTCVAVSVYTGTARTSFRSVGVGGANKPGHGTESDSATYQVLDLEVFGFAVQTNRAGVSYSSSGGSTVDNWTVGTAGNVAIGTFDQTFGTDGNQTIAGSQSSTYPDAFFAAVVAAAIPWTDLVGKPFVTVSPVGMSQTGVWNGGADFGPDTPGATTTNTTTSGIQEALNSIATTGGTIVCLASPTPYSLSTPIYNTGNNQKVIFEAGCVLKFSSSGNYNNWWRNGGGSSAGDNGDIWVGCNYVPYSAGINPATNGQATYHDCYWIGNGAIINCSGQTTTGNNGEQVFNILAYQSAARFGGSGPAPGYNIVIEGFTAVGFGGAAFYMGGSLLAAGATYSQQWRRVRVSRYNASMATNDSSSAFGTGFYVNGCNGLEVEDVSIDCSAVTPGAMPDVSNLYVTSQTGGDTQSIVFRRCHFLSGGAAYDDNSSTDPGSCIEIQGATQPAGGGTRGNTHDILWEDCVFESGSATVQLGGKGGAYIDDYRSGTTADSSSVYNLEFRRCTWINCGMNFTSLTSGYAPGYVLFSGPAPGLISGYLTGRTMIQGPTLTAGGTQPSTSLRQNLPTSNAPIAEYYPKASGHFRISVYLAAVAGGTPNISVTWWDPDINSGFSATLFSSAMLAGSYAQAELTVVAKATVDVVVEGYQSGAGSNIIASVVIEQIQ
jgi:hypothetical protein